MKIKPYLFFALPFFFLLMIFSSSIGCSKNTKTVTPIDTTTTTAPLPPPVDSIPQQATGIGNGVNLQPSYYNNGNVDFAWSLMKQNPKIKTVRIEIEPGVDINQAKSWIQQANDNGYEIIATYHKYTVLG